ncbi:unnamed protein product, partial [Ectocarpus sp. 4 AP-2014]
SCSGSVDSGPDTAPRRLARLRRVSRHRCAKVYIGFHRHDPKFYNIYFRSMLIKCFGVQAPIGLVHFPRCNTVSKYAYQSGRTTVRKTSRKLPHAKDSRPPQSKGIIAVTNDSHVYYVMFLSSSPSFVSVLHL